jgi:hypothetical protein
MRSEPGLGRIVSLYWLYDNVEGGPLTWCASVREDYAVGDCPLVVKVRPELDRNELARRLHELADDLERDPGFFQSIDPDRTCLPDAISPSDDVVF